MDWDSRDGTDGDDTPLKAPGRSESEERRTVEQRIWTNEQGVKYVIRRVDQSTVSVHCGDAAIGRVPVPAALPPLGTTTRAQLRAIVQAAIRERGTRRWESEGGAVPDTKAEES